MTLFDFLAQLLSDFGRVRSLLILVFALLSLVLLVPALGVQIPVWHLLVSRGPVASVRRKLSGTSSSTVDSDQLSATRAAGLAMLLLVGLLADNAWVWAVSVFFVATLITELDFVQNLAAITWNREWAMRAATPAEEVRKYADDLALATPTEAAIGEPLQPEPAAPKSDEPAPNRDTLNRTLILARFEQAAVGRLLARGLFDSVQRHIVLEGPRHESYLIDALGKGGLRDYVIEVKAGLSPTDVPSVLREMTGLMAAYVRARPSHELSREARGILVSSADVRVHLARGVLYLRFDVETSDFLPNRTLDAWIQEERDYRESPI